MNAKIARGLSGPWLYYIAQMVSSAMTLLVPVLLLQYAGVGFFGVVAFASVLQACLQLCDLGLSATLTRTCATSSTESQWLHQRALLRRAEFLVLASTSLAGIFLIWPILHLYQNWSSVSATRPVSLNESLWLIMLSIVTRNQLELYRCALVGTHQLKWLAIDIFLATVLKLGVLVGLIQLDVLTLPWYFLFNIMANTLELLFARFKIFSVFSDFTHLSGRSIEAKVPWKFSLSMAFAAFLWVAFSQTDKLYLSRMWTVDQFAEFSAATLLASGVLIVTQPLQGIFSTRLATRHAEGNIELLTTDYRQATRWAGLLIWPLCAVLIFRAEDVLRVWSGSPKIAKDAAPVLIGYALGNGLVALGGVNFYLQFALGQLRWHLSGALVFLMCLIPTLVWAAERFSLNGAGVAWAGANIVFFLSWVPFVHRKILPFPYLEWLRKDVLPFFLCPTAVMLLLFPFSFSENRIFAFFELGVCYGVCAVVTALVFYESRQWVGSVFLKLIKQF